MLAIKSKFVPLIYFFADAPGFRPFAWIHARIYFQFLAGQVRLGRLGFRIGKNIRKRHFNVSNVLTSMFFAT